ncbi:Eco57I restriction-modification methylase domain-containing protein [Oerskovia sp. KBS0722]|uniref:Eco57I restriction-modification methylase domain-containing protein n=1 Tax=Oerskovia sp. KBS0722 TaxID=1179673 RepID=UPI0011A49AB3|nr:N-6 DNA methylase [Oerskovia sp. KBS0722]QDW62066.1 N-6 DNA methylase [Oerskovia sp. KBS0722]
MTLTERTETRRRDALVALDARAQARLGQFFTPAAASDLIASLVDLDALPPTVRILDPGAGVGSLTVALVERIRGERPDIEVHAVAVEIDPAVTPTLAETLDELSQYDNVTVELIEGDFVALATARDPRLAQPFDLVIQNPPYGKLAAADPSRRAVARALVDVPNIYAAFWALGVHALRPGGQCVAIVPRSWANGTYFEPFRVWMLYHSSIDTLHVFESRSVVFADTGVLQENVIVSGTRGRDSQIVKLTASVGHADDVVTKEVPFAVVVKDDDPHRFVRFTDGATSVPSAAVYTLADLGITASTGRVVDFRSRAWLSQEPEPGSVPMVYQGNIRAGSVVHPRSEVPKPQHYRAAVPEAAKWLVPEGTYVLIKRFSAKEERRRVVAGVWDSPGAVAFDNKTNYLHERKKGLDPDLARGLMLWLNSTPLDQAFRTFSGHTQVNAGDLRVLPFPSREHLVRLGHALPTGVLPDQELIDKLVQEALAD